MADEDIKLGDFVVEYVGEGDNNCFYHLQLQMRIAFPFKTYLRMLLSPLSTVIDDKTCEERLWNMKHRGETNFYLCEINRDMVIDATYKGNKSRYINHSCCPNTEMQKWLTANCFTWSFSSI